MPKAVLFQGVNKFVRHEKGPNQYGPGLIELEVMSQAVGLAKVALEQAGESLAVRASSRAISCTVSWMASRPAALARLARIGLAGGGAVLGLNTHLQVAKRLRRSAPSSVQRHELGFLRCFWSFPLLPQLDIFHL